MLRAGPWAAPPDMPGLRDIKRRIRAVKNTQQITKAMEMVAAAKLRRTQEKVLSARPYARRAQEVLARLLGAGVEADHPLLDRRDGGKVAYVVMGGDRGLCGSYNVNIIRMANAALAVARREQKEVALVPVGRVVRDFFRRRGWQFPLEFTGLGDDPSFSQASLVAGKLTRIFLEGEADEVRVVYTEFISPLQQRPREIILLPISPPEAIGVPDRVAVEYFFEPSPRRVLDALLPKFVEIQVYRTLLEAKTSEHGARMTAMRNATDNAEEMIDQLTLDFNKARQAAITKEISEIVRGAEALRG